MTTKEIDDHFMRLSGVAQFMVGNCALADHNKFFLNLGDAEKLDVLSRSGHSYDPADSNKGVVKSKPGCPSSFGENVSGDDNEEWCRRKQGPDCAGCRHYAGEASSVVKNKKASAPVQMGLFG